MKTTFSLSLAVVLAAAVLSLSACNKEGPVTPTTSNGGNGQNTVANQPTTPEGSDVNTSNTSTTDPNSGATGAGGKTDANVKRVKVAFIDAEGKPTVVVATPRVEKTDEEWRKILTPEQFAIVRSKGTERPFCGPLLDNKKTGVYFCVACGLPLFASNAKFESGTGWPSFFQPIAKENVAERADHSYGMIRVEINCARCDGHLGHVFEDGPRPTGLRYCLNGESLTFTENSKLGPIAEKFKKEIEEATKAGK